MARQLNRMMRVAIALVWTAAIAGVPTAAQDRWADAMAAFEHEDRSAPPPAGGMVFVGSSSIRRWDLARIVWSHARHQPRVRRVARSSTR